MRHTNGQGNEKSHPRNQKGKHTLVVCFFFLLAKRTSCYTTFGLWNDERGSLGDEVKTVEYCFYRRKSIKQGVEGESVPSDAQQLCDWTGICMHLVLFSIISNPISVTIKERTFVYQIKVRSFHVLGVFEPKLL
jgi:hypothetical protein